MAHREATDSMVKQLSETSKQIGQHMLQVVEKLQKKRDSLRAENQELRAMIGDLIFLVKFLLV